MTGPATPRVVIAAPASGHGKTTVATGLMAALGACGYRVSGHKVGPDYIDPGFHQLATGQPPRNLDPFLQGERRVLPLLRAGSRGGDIAVIEGVMGLFDGALGTAGYASTAHLARLTESPVILVVDAAAASRSVAALVYGFAHYDPSVRLAGVILNKLGSRRHEDEIRAAIAPTGIPVLGALRRDEEIHAPSRHLGLVPAREREESSKATIPRLARWVSGGVDLDALVRVARSAAPLRGPVWNPAEHMRSTFDGGGRATVAMASGRAFTFRYTETVELLTAAGIEVVDVDPMTETELPDGCAGLYLGGGFPESHAAELSANDGMRAAIARAAAAGMPIVAECAGLLYLCRELDGAPMAGVLDAEARMTQGGRLGYRDAHAQESTVLTRAGDEVTGHEFHRSEVNPANGTRPAWIWDGDYQGFATANLHASYLHVHWAGHPALAQRFADAARGHATV